MLLVGDIHGNFDIYDSLIKDEKESIQLGDYGLGFPIEEAYTAENSLKVKNGLTYHEAPEGHLFLRGNHDQPNMCKSHPRYLGDFGMFRGEVFYLSGAWSIDQDFRTPGIDWWREEELSYAQLQDAVDLFAKEMPRVVVSHDAPFVVTEIIHHGEGIRNRTCHAMDAMLDEFMPDYWYFAHHHVSWEGKIPNWNTKFKCLNVYETCESVITGP